MSRKPSLLPKPLARMSSGNTAVLSESSPSSTGSPSSSSNSPAENINASSTTSDDHPVTSSLSEVQVRCEERGLAAPLSTAIKYNRDFHSDVKSTSSSTKIASRSRRPNVITANVPVIESSFFKQSGHVKLGTRTKPLVDSAVNVSNVQWDVRKPTTSCLTKPAIDEARVATDVRKSSCDISSRGNAQNVAYRNSGSVYKKTPSQTDLKKRQILLVPKQAGLDVKLEDLLVGSKTSGNNVDVVCCASPSLEIPSLNSEQFPVQNSGENGVSIVQENTISVDDTTDLKLDIPNEMEHCALVNTKVKPAIFPPKATDKVANTKGVANISRVNELQKSERKPNVINSKQISGLEVSEGKPQVKPISTSVSSAYGGLSYAQRRLNLSASKSNLKAPVETNCSISKTVLPAGALVRTEPGLHSVPKIPTALTNKFAKLPTTSKLAITRTSISNLRQKPNEQKLSVLKPARSVSNIAKRDAMSIAPIRNSSTKSTDQEKNKSSSRPSSVYLDKPNANNNHHRSSLDLNVTYVEHFQSVNIPLTADDSHAVAIASPSEFVLKSSDVCSAMGCAEEAGSSSTIVMTSKDVGNRPSSTWRLPVELKRRQVPRTSSAGVCGASAGRAGSRHSDSVIIKNDNFCDSLDSPKIFPFDKKSMPRKTMLSSATEKQLDSDCPVVHENALQDVDNLQNATIANNGNAESVYLQDLLVNRISENIKNSTSKEISLSQTRASSGEITDIPDVSYNKSIVEPTQLRENEIDFSVLSSSHSEVEQNVTLSSEIRRSSSRRSLSSSSLSSSSSSTSPASKSTDTVVDSASSESLYSNPEPTSARPESESAHPICTLTNGALIVEPILSCVPKRPNSITLCSSSVAPPISQSSPRATSVNVCGQPNQNKQVSTSSLDQVRSNAHVPRLDNFKHIQRIENFGRTATIREHFAQASDGVGHHSSKSPMINAENYSTGLQEDLNSSGAGKLMNPHIFENKHVNNIRRPNSLDNYSSSSTLSASNCGSDKAVSEPRRLSHTNNWSIFENYKIKPAETNNPLSRDSNESTSNKIFSANAESSSSSVLSSISAPIIRHSVCEADKKPAAGKYCSSVKSNLSDTFSSTAIDQMQTKRHSMEIANQSSIDCVSSPKLSRLPMKSKLHSSNARTRTNASNDRPVLQFSYPVMNPSGTDRVMPPHIFPAKSSGGDRVTIEEQMFSSNDNNTEQIPSSLNSKRKDFTPKVVRRSLPESTIVQPKLVKPYTAASAAGRNSAFSLLNVKRNVVSSAHVTPVNAESALSKESRGSVISNSVNLKVDEFQSNQGTFDKKNNYNQISTQNNDERNGQTDNISLLRVRNPQTSSININLKAADDRLSLKKDASNQSQRSSSASLFMDLQNRTAAERDPYSAVESVCKTRARDSFGNTFTELNEQKMVSKNCESSCSVPGSVIKWDENLNIDATNKSVNDNLSNNCFSELKYASNFIPNSSKAPQNVSATIEENHMYSFRTDKHRAVIRDKTENYTNLTTSESDKDSSRNSRGSIYAKLVPNAGNVSKSGDSLVLERLDADGANKEELFVVTYESDDIIVLERRVGHGSSLTSSVREMHESPLEAASGHRTALNRKDVALENERRPLTNEFGAIEVVSPELQQRGLPVSESGYDSWKSDGANDPSDSVLSSQARSDFSSGTTRNIQLRSRSTDLRCDADFEKSETGDFNSSFAEPGDRDCVGIAAGKQENVTFDKCDNVETRKELVDYFSASTVSKPISVARLSPVQFRSFLKTVPTRCETINDVVVNSSCSMTPDPSFVSSKKISFLFNVVKENSTSKVNHSCSERLSYTSRASGDGLDREAGKQDCQNNRNSKTETNERNYSENEFSKEQNIVRNAASVGRLKTERQQRQDTYYENVCDDVLESFEANMSDCENF